MNTIKYFRELEEKDEFNVADRNEGVHAWIQPEGIELKFSVNGEHKFTIKGEDIQSPLPIRSYHHENINVFCMTYLHSDGIDIYGDISEEEARRLRDLFTLPSESERIGDYAVIITDVDRFLNQAMQAFKKLGDNGFKGTFKSKSVTYYDPNKTLSLNDADEAVFHKQEQYSHQKEFRFCLDRYAENAEPYPLHIGSVEEYACVCDTKEVNGFLEMLLSAKKPV